LGRAHFLFHFFSYFPRPAHRPFSRTRPPPCSRRSTAPALLDPAPPRPGPAADGTPLPAPRGRNSPPPPLQLWTPSSPFPFFFSTEPNRTAMAAPASSSFGSAPATRPSSRALMAKPQLAPQPSSATLSHFRPLHVETSAVAPCLPEPSLLFRRPMPASSSPRPRPRATSPAPPEMPPFPPPSALWNGVAPLLLRRLHVTPLLG
jgi:hypothetical protein